MDATVLVALVTGSFSLATLILTRYFSNRDKNTEQDHKEDAKYEQLEQEQKNQEESLIDLRQAVNGLIQMQDEQNKMLSLIKDATCSTIRNDIIQMYNKYTSDSYGYMPIHERENLEHLIKGYYGLGGNGVIPNLVKEMESLPTGKQESNK